MLCLYVPSRAEEEDTSGSTFGGESVRLKPEAPAGATGEIARILNAKDYFAVLDVPREADGAEVKKAKMSKMVRVIDCIHAQVCVIDSRSLDCV